MPGSESLRLAITVFRNHFPMHWRAPKSRRPRNCQKESLRIEPLTRKTLLTYTFPMYHPAQQEPEVFGAISSAVRREILDLLADGERPVIGIASHFEMSRPAISQHLRILLSAGLVAEARHGRENRYRLVPERLAPVRDWIAHYERFWDDNFKRLQAHLMKGAGGVEKH